jgi:hypothetical protein
VSGLLSELIEVWFFGQKLSRGQARNVFSFDENGECAVHKPVFAPFDQQFSGYVKAVQQVLVASNAILCGKGAIPVDFGAEILPSRGNQDVHARVIQKSNGKTGGIGKPLENPTKLVQINEVTDGVFSIYKRCIVIIEHSHILANIFYPMD